MANTYVILSSTDGEVKINRTVTDNLLIKGKDLKVVTSDKDEEGIKTFLILESKDGKVKINKTVRKDILVQGKDIKVISTTKEGEPINGREKSKKV